MTCPSFSDRDADHEDLERQFQDDVETEIDAKLEAASAMLAALYEARGELAQFEVTLPGVDAAIATAKAAGIRAGG
jgi:hypothetical protein